jgi:predicted MPP superfamily phosphohydrolase
MLSFGWTTALASALVVVVARLVRGRIFAIFAAVLLTIHGLSATALWNALALGGVFGGLGRGEPRAWIVAVFAALHAIVFVHFLGLARPQLRGTAYRVVVSWPAAAFFAGTFLAVPWAVAYGLGASPPVPWLPFALAALGLAQSLRHRPEELDITVDRSPVDALARHPRGEVRVERPLRLVQITDPHLGAFMSEARLRGLAERAVAKDPDLVLLTGDFLTMESHDAHEALARALGPLAALRGRVFACMGNHDHEAPATVRRALDAIGARLLVDHAELVETAAGAVQVVGLDFHFRDRAARIERALAKCPRVEGAFRLVLLHDPGAFRHVPDGEADLVLSGHTHGGQLGLVSLGLERTIVSTMTTIPDHGYWALGTNRLYVHRGTSHYGFPVRIGVPAEESLVRVHVA